MAEQMKQFVSRHAIPFFMALVIVALLFIAWPQSASFKLEREPASHWFTVERFQVPDFVTGTNPTIEFERTIKRSALGDWLVEVQLVTGGFYNKCSGSGTANYKPEDRLPDPVDFGWFVGGCLDIPPDTYRLEARWDLCIGRICKTIEATSNHFQVLPKDP